jgi:predicted  nucleic acid-binding Zn-ribbon protein
MAMGQKIDQFCEDLRTKLTNIDSGLAGLKTKINGKAQNAEQDVRDHLDEVHKRISRDQAKIAAANAKMANWAEQKKVATDAKIAEWKTKREIAKLRDRADSAEDYAAAARDVAAAALDEAEEASLDAWLARQDADAALAK